MMQGNMLSKANETLIVCHMRDGKFDSIHEYIHAHGTLFKLLIPLGLRVLPLMVKMKSLKN